MILRENVSFIIYPNLKDLINEELLKKIPLSVPMAWECFIKEGSLWYRRFPSELGVDKWLRKADLKEFNEYSITSYLTELTNLIWHSPCYICGGKYPDHFLNRKEKDIIVMYKAHTKCIPIGVKWEPWKNSARGF